METGSFRLLSAEHGTEIKLAMQRLWLTGHVLPVGARLLVRHVFKNGESRNIEVVYSFMLPRDAALRRFKVQGKDFEAHSELKRVQEAVQAYEEGIEAGHLSTLARSYQDGVVNLTLGNIRPGEEVAVTLEILAGVELRDDGLRFRFPFTLAPGYHSGARTIDVNGIGEIELPSEEFGDVILPSYTPGSLKLHEVGFDLAIHVPGSIAMIGSPSHSAQMREERGTRRVTLAVNSDIPNRDLVLDVRVTQPETAVLAGGGSFAMVVPSTMFGRAASGPRRLALVIDRSGSMGGQPMIQAKRAVEACLGALAENDEFALVAFDSVVETFGNTLATATMQNRAAAQAFLSGIDARGGTELALGFAAGATVARGGDVLVITDGQVMGTEEILQKARELNVRIHCLGIGSASQDRFLSLLASATGGVSRFATPRERVDVAAVDLFASISRPVATDVAVSGATVAMKPAQYVFAGTPWTVFGEAPEGSAVDITWAGGKLTQRVTAADKTADGRDGVSDTVRLLDGARRITDLESRMTRKTAPETENALAALSEKFGLASRAMALVSVVKRAGDVAGAPPVTLVVPVGMPQDTEYDAYFGDTLGGASGVLRASRYMNASAAPMPPSVAAPAPSGGAAPQKPGLLKRMFGGGAPTEHGRSRAKRLHLDEDVVSMLEVGPAAPMPAQASPKAERARAFDETDRLMAIASSLAPDGGVPGGSDDERALQTACAVLSFVNEGHTPDEGAFRAHVARMVAYLEGLTGLTPEHKAIIDRVAAFARSGRRPKVAPAKTWADVDAAIK